MQTDSTVTAAPSVAYRRYVLLILTLVYAFNFVDRQIIGILFPFIKADLAINLKEFSEFVNSQEVKEYITEYKGASQLKLQLKDGDNGFYLQVDTFKPQAKQEAKAETVSDFPF